MASRAAPTPVADASGVYAFFEGGNLVGLSDKGVLALAGGLTHCAQLQRLCLHNTPIGDEALGVIRAAVPTGCQVLGLK